MARNHLSAELRSARVFRWARTGLRKSRRGTCLRPQLLPLLGINRVKSQTRLELAEITRQLATLGIDNSKPG
jgi:hypothetical protein